MINKKFKKIITILILIVILFPYGICLAATQAEAGVAIASFAADFCRTKGYQAKENLTIYSWGADRKYGYMLNLNTGTATGCCGNKKYTNKYPMDCVGFVSTVIHQSLGIGSDTDFSFFIQPSKYRDLGYFEKIPSDQKQPGDVYMNSGHVMIYVGEYGGEYSIAESWCANEFRGALLTNSDTSGYTLWRIKRSQIEDLDPMELVTDVSGTTGVTGTTSIFNKGEKSDFYYNGIPDGKYSVTSVNALDWIINILKEIFSFIVNIITYVIRMVFVGWTFLVENMATGIVKNISGEEDVIKVDATDYGETGNKVTDDNITIEKIIFDDVKVFDINFFSTEP